MTITPICLAVDGVSVVVVTLVDCRGLTVGSWAVDDLARPVCSVVASFGVVVIVMVDSAVAVVCVVTMGS